MMSTRAARDRVAASRSAGAGGQALGLEGGRGSFTASRLRSTRMPARRCRVNRPSWTVTSRMFVMYRVGRSRGIDLLMGESRARRFPS